MKYVSSFSYISQRKIGKKYGISFLISQSFLYLAIMIGLCFSFLGIQPAYAQCNALCMYERENSAEFGRNSYGRKDKGFSLAPGYDIALSDSDSDADSVGEENLIAAADDKGTSTVFLNAPSDEWRFSITPYLWMMGLNGEAGVKGQTADLDVSFGDILDNLDFGVQVHMEAWRERFGFFVDLTYSKITLKGDAQLKFDRSINIKSVTETFLGEFVGFYRVGTWAIGSNGQSTNNSFTFDILGGGRLWWMENTVDIKGPVGLDPRFSGSKTWFDFIVGGRAAVTINKIFIALRSDIGGFDLGFSSDISWNIAGYIGYELPWYQITPVIGYRALYDKYDDGSGDNRFLWDAWMYGPQLGVVFPF